MAYQSSIFNAVSEGNLSVIRSLLSSNPDLIDARNESRISLILWAIYNHQMEIAGFLKERKKSLDIFEVAAIGDTINVVKLLEKDNNIINSYSPDGYTPLGYAAFFGYLETAAVLLSYGANPNACSNNEFKIFPIHSAVTYQNSTIAFEMTRLLLSFHAEINVKQHEGWTPLHQAASYGYSNLVKLLLNNGADKNITNNDGMTPLDIASESRHDKIIQLLRLG